MNRTSLAGAFAAALALSALTASAAHAEPVEHIVNGTFDAGTAPWWWTGNAPGSIVDGQLCAPVPGGTVNPWDAIIGQNDIPLVGGQTYTFAFTVSATAAVSVRANVQLADPPFSTAFSRDLPAGAAARHSFTFTSGVDSPAGQVAFQVGGSAQPWTLCLDDVSLTGGEAPPPDGPEQVDNGDFSDGTAPWWSSGVSTPAVVDGQLCAQVPGGLANPWDANIGQNNIPLVNGESYTFSFAASGSPAALVRVAVQLNEPPFTAPLSQMVTVGAAEARSFVFTSTLDSDNGQVVFQLGGSPDPYTFCVDNVSLRGGEEPPVYQPDTGPRVRVNQVGYLPGGPKNATLVTDATGPLPWTLVDAAEVTVASGTTTPRGVDDSSGQNVHTIDFTGFRGSGTGFRLTADGETSFPFDISAGIYRQLRSDSLQFFYIQRSGIAIDGALVGEQYARPAGHLGVAPNQGDTDVACQPGVCDYRLDVRGGWYDAGDHGKYVVNGGIATYQLLAAFERTKNAPTAGLGRALGDSTLRVPERGNRVPDILDEARWELEFLLRMQVPAGQPLAGMAHHKIHDRNWTGLPLQPQDDDQLRELHPPSTAATLNLAATAAHGARLYALYDPAFAGRLLAAAGTAYTAAKTNPDRFADPADGNGGGAYSDGDVSDEFYWAAAELYLTTGDAAYLADLRASPHHTGDVFPANGFNWPVTAALGRLDLATVPSGLPAAELARVRASVTEAADARLATLAGQAYGLPHPGGAGNYFWGSNSNIINNVIVLATAFDLTGDARYRAGALQGMDYIFGRNALNHSYVTGWGEKSPQNQHSRIFGHQLDESLPNPPAGSLAGGANANLDDPFAARLLDGCPAQLCYVDHIESYSTNEVAINWNSALAWVGSWLADQGAAEAAPAPPVRCRVTYVQHGEWPGAFTAQVTLQNLGSAPLDDWVLAWAFTGAQRVGHHWSSGITQDGATVTVRNLSWNGRILPGQSETFGFNATTALANPVPALFLVNGAAC